VLDHGGEVLKFIGDPVMAIFPIDGSRRPAGEMARAAVMTAREALSRAAASNAVRVEHRLPPFPLGIGLHAGEVMYDNVGTRQRLEGLCKPLSVPVVASGRFAAAYRAELHSLGSHRLTGLPGGARALHPAGIRRDISASAAEGTTQRGGRIPAPCDIRERRNRVQPRIGILNSAPARMPVGQRVVTALSLV